MVTFMFNTIKRFYLTSPTTIYLQNAEYNRECTDHASVMTPYVFGLTVLAVWSAHVDWPPPETHGLTEEELDKQPNAVWALLSRDNYIIGMSPLHERKINRLYKCAATDYIHRKSHAIDALVADRFDPSLFRPLRTYVELYTGPLVTATAIAAAILWPRYHSGH